MMNIYFSPQENNVDKLEYKFKGEVITATLNGVSDVFDFTGLPDGIAADIESALPTNPFLKVERINGTLFIELLNYIKRGATEFERFPNWIEVGEEIGSN